MAFCGVCLLKGQVDLSCRIDFSLICLALWEHRTIVCLCPVLHVCQHVTCPDQDNISEVVDVTSELRLR